MKLSRLWQPRKLLFWQMVMFNVLSSVCSWALRALPLNAVAMLIITLVALTNVGFGLLAAWMLMREDPSQQPASSDVTASQHPPAP